MSTPGSGGSGWRSTPAGGRGARRRWQVDHSSARGGRLPVRAKRAIFGLLTLGCAMVIGWLLSIWVLDRVPHAKVVTFGISDYHQPIIPRNPFGKEDATAFQSLQERSPWQFTVVDNPNNLTGGDILKRIGGDRENLSNQNLIVFCNLHGRLAADATTGQLEAQFYGINADGAGGTEPVSDEAERKMVPLPALIRELKETQAKHVLLLVEAGQLQPNWPLGILANEFVGQLRQHVTDAGVSNFSVLCSALPYEVSQTLPAVAASKVVEPAAGEAETPQSEAAESGIDLKNQSVFAHFVLEGLKGKADGWGPTAATSQNPEPGEVSQFFPKHHRPDRRVDTDELYAYAAQKVADWNGNEGGGNVQTVTRLDSHNFVIASFSDKQKLTKAVAAAVADKKAEPAKAAPKTAAATPAKKTVSPVAKPLVAKPAAAKPSGPTTVNPKLFDAVLSAAADDPKIIQALKTALAGNALHKRTQQEFLGKWLIEQALQQNPAPVVFNARPLINEIEEANRPPELELLRRLLELEQSTDKSRVSPPSDECRTALLSRQQAEQLMTRVGELPPHLIRELQAALKALTAAERWLLFSHSHQEARTSSRDWYGKFAEHVRNVHDGATRFSAATKLTADVRRQLPRLAGHAADRAERGDIPTSWNDLRKLGTWMAQNAQSGVDEVPPLEVLTQLPDETEKLLKLVRSSSKLDRMVAQLAPDTDLKLALGATQTLWDQLPKQLPRPATALNAQTAGVWQGFWAIETLRFRGLPRTDLSVLWQGWNEMIAAGESDAAADAVAEPSMRLPRVLLGAMIQHAWARTSDGTSAPGTPGGADTKSPVQEITAWRQRLRDLDRGPETCLRLTQADGSAEGSVNPEARDTKFVLTTKPDQKSPAGAARLDVRIVRPKNHSEESLSLCWWGPELVSLNYGESREKSFKIEPTTNELKLNLRLSEKTKQTQPLLVALLGSEDFPLEIRSVRVEPPFDESQWKIVFKTEKGKLAYQPTTKTEAKLFLLPADEVTLVPYLVGPRLPDVKGIDVAVSRMTAEGEVPIAALKNVVLEKMVKNENAGPDSKQGSTDSLEEAKLTFGLKPPPAAGAPAAPAPAVEPPKLDISGGLKFVIQPQGPTDVTYPAVTYLVPIAFFSKTAFIEPPQPEFDCQQLKIRIPVKRERFNAETNPLLEKSVFVELQLSPELARRVAGRFSPAMELKPTDLKSKDLFIELPEIASDEAPGELSMSLAIAGLPHAYRWDVDPREPRPVQASKRTAVRIASPVPSVAYFRDKADKLSWFHDGESKPTEIELRIEVDSPDLNATVDGKQWKLNYELQGRGAPIDSRSWDLSTSLNKSVTLAIKDGAWKLATTTSDFVYQIPTKSKLTGRFTLQAELRGPGNSLADSDEINLAIDATAPDVKFAPLPATHPPGADLKFRVDVADPESGVFEVVAGIDLDRDGKLGETETLQTIVDPPPRPQFTVPQDMVPPTGGRYKLIVMATNRTRVQSSREVSELISFLPPELPKAETTGTLRVVIDKGTRFVTWKISGQANVSEKTEKGETTYEFKDLDPGEYEIEVITFTDIGKAKKKVEAGKTAIATLKMQPR